MTKHPPSDASEGIERHSAREVSDETPGKSDGPPDGDGRHRRVLRYEEHHKMSAGPIPAPETLFEYGRIDRSFPERLVSAFERQSEHRQNMERTLLTGSERRAGRGQIIGSSLVGIALAGGILAILLGNPVAGASIIVPALAGGVLTYLFGFGPRDK